MSVEQIIKEKVARILLAEDYDDLREMISELLRGQNHIVEAVSNGMVAAKTIKEQAFDLMILDWELPKITGIEVLKSYRAVGGTTPVLMLTGRKKLSDKEAGLDAGADDYLTKPFHPQELTARIRALLRRAAIPVRQPATAVELNSGSLFAERYEIMETHGRGSSGIIYKARQIYLDRLVALKVLHPQLIDDAETIARFKREAQAVSLLDHPNIIRVYDFGITSASLPYLVMDYCPGTTLSQSLCQQDHLPVEQAVPIFIQVCDGLAHAHSKGVIHRDVKPSNLLISENENGGCVVKIADFGIAKVPEGGAAMEVTKNGDVLGSPSYMSPEQCMGQELDARTDIFSVGCVMFAAITGRDAFVGENVLDTMYRRTVENAPRFSAVRDDIACPQALEAIVLKALARQKDRRYQSVSDLKRDLEDLYSTILS